MTEDRKAALLKQLQKRTKKKKTKTKKKAKAKKKKTKAKTKPKPKTLSKPDNPPDKNKGGRPKFFDDEKLEELQAFMRLNPTREDTCAFFKCSEACLTTTIQENFNGIGFKEFKSRHMVHTRMGLIRVAVKQAMTGTNNMMMVKCLENICGWGKGYKDDPTGNKYSEMTDDEINNRIQEIMKEFNGPQSSG